MSLNSKKSWNPGSSANKAKVQKREEDEIERRRKAEQRRQQLEQERRQEDAGDEPSRSSTGPNKTAWMYTDSKPAKPQMRANAAKPDGQSALLLGARKIDDAVLAEKQADAKQARDAARKQAADPMAAVLAKQTAKRKTASRTDDARVSKSQKHR